jgi:hypothetical protein
LKLASLRQSRKVVQIDRTTEGNLTDLQEEEVKATEKEEEKEDEFAYARSHEASKFAYETCKTIAQSCLIINGGAATAVIALLSKDKVDQSLLTWVPWGIGGYALGVVSSAFMLFCVMMMADNWNYAWYWWSYGDNEKFGDEYETVAGRWHKGMYAAFVVPIVCFVVGSGFVAYGLARSKPTSTGPFPTVIYLPALK